jgi:hypothetical protein
MFSNFLFGNNFEKTVVLNHYNPFKESINQEFEVNQYYTSVFWVYQNRLILCGKFFNLPNIIFQINDSSLSNNHGDIVIAQIKITSHKLLYQANLVNIIGKMQPPKFGFLPPKYTQLVKGKVLSDEEFADDYYRFLVLDKRKKINIIQPITFKSLVKTNKVEYYNFIDTNDFASFLIEYDHYCIGEKLKKGFIIKNNESILMINASNYKQNKRKMLITKVNSLVTKFVNEKHLKISILNEILALSANCYTQNFYLSEEHKIKIEKKINEFESSRRPLFNFDCEIVHYYFELESVSNLLKIKNPTLFNQTGFRNILLAINNIIDSKNKNQIDALLNLTEFALLKLDQNKISTLIRGLLETNIFRISHLNQCIFIEFTLEIVDILEHLPYNDDINKELYNYLKEFKNYNQNSFDNFKLFLLIEKIYLYLNKQNKSENYRLSHVELLESTSVLLENLKSKYFNNQKLF